MVKAMENVKVLTEFQICISSIYFVLFCLFKSGSSNMIFQIILALIAQDLRQVTNFFEHQFTHLLKRDNHV